MKYYPTYLQSLGLLLILILCIVLSLLLVVPLFPSKSDVSSFVMDCLPFCLAIGFGLLIRGEYAFPSKPFPIAIVLIGAVSLIALHLFLDPLISLIPPS